jgi:hypothetical protein
MSNEKKIQFETLQVYEGKEQADPVTDSSEETIHQTAS